MPINSEGLHCGSVGLRCWAALAMGRRTREQAGRARASAPARCSGAALQRQQRQEARLLLARRPARGRLLRSRRSLQHRRLLQKRQQCCALRRLLQVHQSQLLLRLPWPAGSGSAHAAAVEQQASGDSRGPTGHAAALLLPKPDVPSSKGARGLGAGSPSGDKAPHRLGLSPVSNGAGKKTSPKPKACSGSGNIIRAGGLRSRCTPVVVLTGKFAAAKAMPGADAGELPCMVPAECACPFAQHASMFFGLIHR